MNINILWVDDEIDLLRPHILFLEQKGYVLQTATNGEDAMDMVKQKDFDLIFLDENMPGITGLETLTLIKEVRPSIPVVMITKSEEENIMDQAVGSKIADYLIKPVNPNQVLLSIKKHVHNRDLVTEKTTADYRSAFGQIGMQIGQANSFDAWSEIYRRLVQWSLQIGESTDSGIAEVFAMQMAEANVEFGKFIKSNYTRWFQTNSTDRPLMSHNVLRERVFPVVDSGQKVLLILIDNLRFDQWKAIDGIIAPYLRVENEEIYCSILQTATQYARNALFSGLMPLEIQKLHPNFWVFDEDDSGKNLFEEELLTKQLQRLGKNYKMYYEKTKTLKSGSQITSNLKGVLNNEITVLVYNFIDVISHARTEMEMMRQLASDEAAYISLTRSWFSHSDLFELMKEAAKNQVTVIITTDHG